jgi:hypothetical protein
VGRLCASRMIFMQGVMHFVAAVLRRSHRYE